ncbi:hypothetical protein ACFFRR_006097 [Megaselia abdita]
MEGLIFLLIVSVAVFTTGNKIVNDFPEEGDYCVISEDLFWRSESLLNPNQYYHCVDRRVVTGTCPYNMGFLKTGDKGCSLFTTWPCIRPIIFDSSCEKSLNGSVVPIPNPNEYGYCFNGRPFSYHFCPMGFGFIDRFDFLGCTSWKTWNKYTGCF